MHPMTEQSICIDCYQLDKTSLAVDSVEIMCTPKKKCFNTLQLRRTGTGTGK